MASSLLSDLSHDELFNILDFIYPFFSEYSKALGGKAFEPRNKREYLAKIIFGILKGTPERKDWILDFRDDCSAIMGSKIASSLNYNEYFYKNFDVSNIYAPSLFLRKIYEDVVHEVKNWLLIAKKGLFYEVLVGNDIPVVQLFWESLFHMIRDTPNIMGCMKFKQYYNLELPIIQDTILQNTMLHVMKAVEEPVWLLETFINNSIMHPKYAFGLGFINYLKYYKFKEDKEHELHKDAIVAFQDWTTIASQVHYKEFLKFLSDSFDRYPLIFRDSTYTDFINCQFERDFWYISKFTPDLAKFLYVERNIPINPKKSQTLLALLSSTPVFLQLLENNSKEQDETKRKSFLSSVFLNSNLLQSSILNLRFEIIDACYNYLDENLTQKAIDSHFSKCPIVKDFIFAALDVDDCRDPIPITKAVIENIQRFTLLFERCNRKIFKSDLASILYNLVNDCQGVLHLINEETYEWNDRFLIFTELFQNLVSPNIDELPEHNLGYIFYTFNYEKVIKFLFEQPPKFQYMLARYVPLTVNDSILKIVEDHVGNKNSHYEKMQSRKLDNQSDNKSSLNL